MSRGTPGENLHLLLIDGNNLLHRTHGAVTAGAQRALFGHLRAALPGVRKVVVFDGRRQPGERPIEPQTAGLELRYAGGPADDVLISLIGDVPWHERGWTVLVTDDRALTERARSAGVLTRRLDWLIDALGRSRR